VRFADASDKAVQGFSVAEHISRVGIQIYPGT
jgi:hypothetical protein